MSAILPSHVQIPSDVLFQELEGESVLLNLQSERYYGLDDIGTRLWQLLAENGDVAAACEQLVKEYDVEEDILRQDVAQLITKMADAGLVQLDGASTDEERTHQAQ
jgi:hypothetical protein